MSQHWLKSQVPYFITIKDHDSIQTLNTTTNTLSTSSGTQSHQTFKINVKIKYPVIKFLFSDDPPPSELQDEDILLELDETGINVVSACTSNGEVYQVTGDVKVSEQDTEMIKSLTIDRIGAHLDGVTEVLKDVELKAHEGILTDDDEEAELDTVKELVNVFRRRNELLLGCL